MDEQDIEVAGVRCAQCGGEVYMNTCPEHMWVTSSDCLDCGLHYDVGPCHDCTARRLVGSMTQPPQSGEGE